MTKIWVFVTCLQEMCRWDWRLTHFPNYLILGPQPLVYNWNQSRYTVTIAPGQILFLIKSPSAVLGSWIKMLLDIWMLILKKPFKNWRWCFCPVLCLDIPVKVAATTMWDVLKPISRLRNRTLGTSWSVPLTKESHERTVLCSLSWGRVWVQGYGSQGYRALLTETLYWNDGSTQGTLLRAYSFLKSLG